MVTISRSGSSALKAAAAIQYLRCDALLTAHSVSRAPTAVTSLSLRVISYNILAQACGVKGVFRPPPPPPTPNLPALLATTRQRNRIKVLLTLLSALSADFLCVQRNRFKVLLTLLPALSADFLCVQEMDEYEAVYRQPMAAAGWESVYVKRPGKKRDGSGIFYRSSRFRLLRWQPINFNDLVPPDHPDQPNQPAQADTPSPDSSEETRDLSASHVSEATEKPSAGADLDPACADVKLAQAHYLLQQVAQFRSSIVPSAHSHTSASVTSAAGSTPVTIICGDFNSLPGDPLQIPLRLELQFMVPARARHGASARPAHGMGPAGVVSASNHALLEQRTSWGQQVSSVPTTTLTFESTQKSAAHVIRQQVSSVPTTMLTLESTQKSPLTFSPFSFPDHPPPALQLLEQRTSWAVGAAHVVGSAGVVGASSHAAQPLNSAAHVVGSAGVIGASNHALLEQRTSWGQQVSSVLLAMLAAAVLASPLSAAHRLSRVDTCHAHGRGSGAVETDVTSAFTQSGRPASLPFLGDFENVSKSSLSSPPLPLPSPPIRSRPASISLLGAAGTIAGTLVGFSLAGPSLGVEGWKVAACFCATYIGGSVNYAAMLRHGQSQQEQQQPARGAAYSQQAWRWTTFSWLLTSQCLLLSASLPSHHHTPQDLGMEITAGAAAASMGASLLTAGMAVDDLLMAAYFSVLYVSLAPPVRSFLYAHAYQALGMDITAGAAAASTGASLLTAGMAVDNLLMAAYFSVLAALPDSWPKPWGGERWGGVKIGGNSDESEKRLDTGLSAPLLHSSPSPSSPSPSASSSSSSSLHTPAPLPSPSPPSSSSSHLTHSPPPAPSVESLTLSIAAAASACALADKIAVHLPPVMASAQLALAALLASLLSTVAARLTGRGEKRKEGEEGEEGGSLFTGAETLETP
ncbi:unnamed protein product [Closterium sp. NIES-64]|nr:unnamed protein product [Closterium sp. NIES-64]